MSKSPATAGLPAAPPLPRPGRAGARAGVRGPGGVA
jgi:hypothetical protein